MTIETLKTFFMWASIINFAILMFYFLFTLVGRRFILAMMKKLTFMNDETAIKVIYLCLGMLKIFWLAFFVTPYIALTMM